MFKFKTILFALFILTLAILMDGSAYSLYSLHLTDNGATFNLIRLSYLTAGMFFDLVLAVFLLVFARMFFVNSDQSKGLSIFLGATGAIFSFLLLLIISTQSFVDFSANLPDNTFVSKILVELYIAGPRSYLTISAMVIFNFVIFNFFRNTTPQLEDNNWIKFVIMGITIFILSIAFLLDITASSYKLSTFPLVFWGILMEITVTASILLLGWLVLSRSSKSIFLSIFLIFVSGGIAFVLPFTIGILHSPWEIFGLQITRYIITPLRASGVHSYLTICAVFIFCIGIANLFRKGRVTSNLFSEGASKFPAQ